MQNTLDAAFRIRIPFPPLLKPQDVIILDTESEDQNITVFGTYHIGDSYLTQIFFPTPISPARLQQTTLYRQTVAVPRYRIAIYNVHHEARLFGLDRHRCIELQPAPYVAKERFISLQSLSRARSRHLPSWGPATYGEIGFHNYSCLIKEIVLYLGRENFTRVHVKQRYLQEVARIVQEP